MRLINTRTYEITEFLGRIPQYAILSHTWGSDELSLQEWQRMNTSDLFNCPKSGCKKVLQACALARLDWLDFIWVDTVCIDKTSSAELSEAINSMFSWYQMSKICYAYLADVEPISNHGLPKTSIRESRWFTRGWTLQELLAPRLLVMLAQDWSKLGYLDTISDLVSDITGIPEDALLNFQPSGSTSVGQRLSWVSNRITTRLEDIAYCMLGILDVNLTLLYGEGKKAFLRLQEELIKVSDDHTLFVWSYMPEIHSGFFPAARREQLRALHSREAEYLIRQEARGATNNYPIERVAHLVLNDHWNNESRAPVSMLSSDPVAFYDCGSYSRSQHAQFNSFTPYETNNLGLSIRLPVFETFESGRLVLIALGCERRHLESEVVCLVLERVRPGYHVFRRPNYPHHPTLLSGMARPAWHYKFKKIQVLRSVNMVLYADTSEAWRRLLIVFPLGMNGNIKVASHDPHGGWSSGGLLFRHPGECSILTANYLRFEGPEGKMTIYVGLEFLSTGGVQWYCEIDPEPESSTFHLWERGLHREELLSEDDWLEMRRHQVGGGKISSYFITVAFGDDIVVGPHEPAQVMQVFFHPNDALLEEADIDL
ncbi:heterokaryon incompatibility protein-domain-containing protein [Dactylonectria macrodidyma]|uniref:Heterokaryon incompatibility protein-domain-containing protein n=1 Tax=Dactylonectria macrodidyma TaxID=307937 RepID=A0A9P9IIA8_9HYPO|nr:heterokaryon incompatibility protein-domain-containing protein [Dactylonectria macrodidyma]